MGPGRRTVHLLSLTHRSLQHAQPLRSMSAATTAATYAGAQQPGVADIAAGGNAAASSGALGAVGEMKRSLELNKAPASRFAQLATVRADGTPACRTVVFRGFTAGVLPGLPSCALQFSTDTLSEKCEQLAANPAAELCWWFPESQEQYRVQGTLQLVTADFSEDGGPPQPALPRRAQHTAAAQLSASATPTSARGGRAGEGSAGAVGTDEPPGPAVMAVACPKVGAAGSD